MEKYSEITTMEIIDWDIADKVHVNHKVMFISFNLSISFLDV